MLLAMGKGEAMLSEDLRKEIRSRPVLARPGDAALKLRIATPESRIESLQPGIVTLQP